MVEDNDAPVFPFPGRVREEGKVATLLNSAKLGGADDIVEKTMEDFQIGYFFTANLELVAAWAFKVP